jgi:DNA-binding CsgD family transcriptional regulator
MPDHVVTPSDIIPIVHAGEVDDATQLLAERMFPRMVVVTGELGAGKSIVLARVAANLAARGRQVRYVWDAADVPDTGVGAAELWVIDDLHAVPPADLPAFVRLLVGALSSHPDLRVLASVDASRFGTLRSDVERLSALVELRPLAPHVSLAFTDRRAARSARTVRLHLAEAAGGNIALLDQAVRDYGASDQLHAALTGAGIRRLPARYEHVSEDFLQLSDASRRLLALVAVCGAAEVALSRFDDAEREALLVLTGEAPSFLRRVGAEQVRFTSNVHRAAALLGCSADERRRAHRRAAEVSGDARERAMHASLGAASDDPAALDAALALGPTPGITLRVLWTAAAAAGQEGERGARLRSAARVALADGDLVVAATALADASVGRFDPWVSAASELVAQLRDAGMSTVGPDAPAVLADILERLDGAVDPLAQVEAATTRQMVEAMRGAWTLIHRGDWREAARILSSVRMEALRAGVGLVDAVSSAYLSLVDALAGRTVSASARSKYVVGDVHRGRHPIARTAAWQAQLHLAVTGDDAGAAQALEHASSDPLRLLAWTPYPLGLVMDLVDARAMGVVAAKYPLGVVGELPGVHPFAAAYAAAIDAQDERISRLGQLLASPRLQAGPFETARVRFRYGLALASAHHVAQARSQLLAAAAEFERWGAAAWHARALAAADVSGPAKAVAPERHGPPTTPLTFQEERVVTLAATGLSNKEISRRLYLSPRTVGGHLYNAYPKLGVTSRAALRDALLRREADGAQRMDPAS